ncbi:hypothetical protein ILUMI_00475 [Ignelater luminosus]|uniref:HTH CENPB-type domain-containing protein n=1 Tax=Ignelater luminosus TaxID=2038154 RepID=A0A8K0DLS4_IGNLU|nr:hypothetical protein ILUMI_00475 [Ignelater luminosus]
MPITYKRTTVREWDSTNTHKAIEAVLQNKLSIRNAAQEFGEKKSCLVYLVKTAREDGIDKVELLVPNFKKSAVIAAEMENSLKEYILKCSSMFYGLSPRAIRRLAYELAIVNKLQVPKSWTERKMAGESWLATFVKRYQSLSIRTPKSTSLAKMTSFNKHNVEVFFNKLKQVLERYKFTAGEIVNLDKTGVSRVPKIQKVLSKKGAKQVG